MGIPWEGLINRTSLKKNFSSPVTTDSKEEAWLKLCKYARASMQHVGTLQSKETMEDKLNLNPYWITGFTDGEGCFSVSFNRREKLRLKVEVRPSFSISESCKRGSPLRGLDRVQEYFGCGFQRYSRADGTYKYEIRSLNQLCEKVIPHFDQYPLETAKKADFIIFRKIVLWMREGKHLHRESFLEMLDLAFETNPAGKRKYDKRSLLRFLKS
jgi:hypothetical protein